jgi:hypothetical protein
MTIWYLITKDGKPFVNVIQGPVTADGRAAEYAKYADPDHGWAQTEVTSATQVICEEGPTEHGVPSATHHLTAVGQCAYCGRSRQDIAVRYGRTGGVNNGTASRHSRS